MQRSSLAVSVAAVGGVALILVAIAVAVWLVPPQLAPPQSRSATPTDRGPRLKPRSRLTSRQTVEGEGLFGIRIPAIGVQAPVIPLGLTKEQRLEVPGRADQAGWWSGGKLPGQKGAAVIAGHVDSSTGPAVFFRLRELEPGDVVEVEPRGRRRVRFVVDRLKKAPKDSFPTREVYGPTSRSELRLVTCTGSFNESSGHYRDNLIVFARRL